MSGHHQFGIHLKCGTERRQLHSVESLARVWHCPETMMRVAGSISVTGKMFDCRGHSLRLNPSDHRRRQFPHQNRIFAKRTYSDNGVIGVDVDICTGRIIDIDAKRSHLTPKDLASLAGKFRRTGCAKCHIARQRGAIAERHKLTTLLIGGDEQKWQTQLLRKVLKRLRQRFDLHGRIHIEWTK